MARIAAQIRDPTGDAYYGGIGAPRLLQMHPSDHLAHLEGRKSDFHAYAYMEAIIVLFCSWTGSYRKPPARCSAVCWASHVLIETAAVQRRKLGGY